MDTWRFLRFFILCLTLGVMALPAQAELQSVRVGGELRVRGTYWRHSFNPRVNPWLVGPETRIPAGLMRSRPIGDALGGQNATSYWDWDDDGADYRLVEQRTALNVRADFTNSVGAFVEFAAFDVWGEDFRSKDYLSGVDKRANSSDDVQIYQAYIDVGDFFGAPLRLRVGRQDLVFGSGWLVGNSSNHPEFRGLSFDGIRLTYAVDAFSVDAFWTKLVERTWVDSHGDIDFSGIYATCTALENVSFDAYWLWLRDARNVEDFDGGPLTEWIEDLRGVDDYDTTHAHTVGLRAAGRLGAFDFDAEAAYQFGDAGQIGSLFKRLVYGDDDAKFDAWAAHLEAGYTLDVRWQPRFYVRGAYFDGEDNRDVGFLEWLNPLGRPESSVSFNRLFSNAVYSNLFDEMGQLSNAWTVRAGIEVAPAEALEISLSGAYFAVVEPFDLPKRVRVLGLVIPVAGPFSFWDEEADSDLGWDISLVAVYHYSEDLDFEAGWTHLFTGDGLTQGNYVDFNGLLFSGGTDDSDADYLYLQTLIRF